MLFSIHTRHSECFWHQRHRTARGLVCKNVRLSNAVSMKYVEMRPAHCCWYVHVSCVFLSFHVHFRWLERNSVFGVISETKEAKALWIRTSRCIQTAVRFYPQSVSTAFRGLEYGIHRNRRNTHEVLPRIYMTWAYSLKIHEVKMLPGWICVNAPKRSFLVMSHHLIPPLTCNLTACEVQTATSNSDYVENS